MDIPTSPRIPQAGSTATRALILGGGGSAGNAWLIGMVAGLADAGLDVTTADLIVGTSAGATAAAQLTSAPPVALLEQVLAAPLPQPRSPIPGGPRRPSTSEHMQRTQRIIDASHDIADMRRRMGDAAIALADVSEGASARWRATVAARLPLPDWPEQRVLITAVDADTGEPAVFDRHSGVDLIDAVAASCASGFAYAVGAHRYIDGGYRCNAENADLAAGYDRVLVLSPFAGSTRVPESWRTSLAANIADLRRDGSRVETIFPDDAARAAFGDNVMDPSTRAPAARAGFTHGRTAAERFARFWS